MYAGWGSCSVSVIPPKNGYKEEYTLNQYFDFSTESVQPITQWLYNGYYSCNASVPYYDTVDRTEVVCDYTPNAKFSVMVINPLGDQTTVRLTSNSTDRDGDVVAYDWYVDGVNKGSSRLITFPIYSSGYRTIKLTVTDNDGYTSTISRNENWSVAPTCGEFC